MRLVIPAALWFNGRMSITVHEIDLRVMNVRARIPFRYGIVTMTAMPHLFVKVHTEIDGKRASGIAADHLPPKWFTKNPTSHYRDDLAEMIDVIHMARDHAIAAKGASSVFGWWDDVYAEQKRSATKKNYPPLLWGFGVSLVERGLIDAYCRATEMSFSQALRAKRLGIDLRKLCGGPEWAICEDIGSADYTKLLPARPLQSIIARHTVGLIDPLTDADIPDSERVSDGLPQSLEASIRAYGLTHFKIKLGGDVQNDLARLRAIAEIIERNTEGHYAFTLDGNENFKEIAPFHSLWLELFGDEKLRHFLSRLIFVEQPLHRDLALSDAVRDALWAWPERPPMTIDESDGQLGDLGRAISYGYSGTSHKNCKGIFKGIANACVIGQLRKTNPSGRYILSGEDLSNIGPIALLQDLAICANLGIDHVERNGQHYFAGLSLFPTDVQEAVLGAHGDVYRRHERGFPTVNLRDGRIDIASTVAAPLGVGFDMDVDQFTPLDEWKFESLGL
jgi:hypothetical protein